MNEEKFKAVCQKLFELYKVKNKHYGNSFHKQFETFGLNSVVMRLGDKYERLKTLVTTNPSDCGDEPITDTLMDMANYSILALMEILDVDTVESEGKNEN